MAVNRRFTGFSGIRVDLPLLRSIESGVSADFDSLLRNFVTGTDEPYIASGFEIQIPDAAINASSLQITVAESVILHSTATESGTILTVPIGTSDDTLNSSNAKVLGSFQNGVPNYVGLELVRISDIDSVDQVGVWSEAQKTEFNRTAPVGQVLEYRYVINTSGFSTNLPLYIVGVSSTGSVEYITNARKKLFRLGTGGTVPNPLNSFNFGGLVNSQEGSSIRREWINESTGTVSNPVSALPGDDPLAFRYGDWSINTLKEWMDAIMTRLKDLTGSEYWYTSSQLFTDVGTGINTFDLWWDSVGSVLTGEGTLSFNQILEITDLDSGYIQTRVSDPSILPGDVIVQGAESGNQANLQAVNNTQLVINSPTKDFFTFNEALRIRRFWRPNLAEFQLDDDVRQSNSTRIAKFERLPGVASGASISVTAWSYVDTLITVTTGAAHGMEVGDYCSTRNLESTTNESVPNGVFLIKDVPSATQMVFSATIAPTGSGTVSPISVVNLDSGIRHPFLPRFSIDEWSYSGTIITVNCGRHSVKTGDTIIVSGLSSTTNTPNGRILGVTVNPDLTISYTASVAPTGTPELDNSRDSLVRYDEYAFLGTIDGASPLEYEFSDVQLTARDDANFFYELGPDSLPSLPTASGAIEVNGLIGLSTVADPARIARIDNDGIGNLTVTTYNKHGYSTIPGPIDFTLFGQQSISPFIRTYEDVAIDSITRTITSIEQAGTVGTTLVGFLGVGSLTGDILTVNGVNFIADTDFTVGVDPIATAGNLATAINDSVHVNIDGVLSANDNLDGTVTISAFNAGYSGNSIAVSSNDVDGEMIVSSPTLVGGQAYLIVETDVNHGFYVGNTVAISGTATPAWNTELPILTIDSVTGFKLLLPTGDGLAGPEVVGSATNLTQFLIEPVPPNGTTLLPPPLEFVNTGNQEAFARFPSNPYAGPIQWSSDMINKGIIGDKAFVIPQTATASGTSEANRFNINGLTGTIYLQDGEVAYVLLDRNKEISDGATYSMVGSDTVSGAIPPLRGDGTPLESGDFVKFQGEDEGKWLRVAGVPGAQITTTSFQLIGDNGQPPSSDQRPGNSGVLLYFRGIYNTILAAKHWQVPPSPDIYWLGARRDNDAQVARIYLKGLELEEGEVREISDNAPSNHLLYTGANTESSINPNYTTKTTGAYYETQILNVGENVEDVDINTRQITLVEGPELGFQRGDQLTFDDGGIPRTYTIDFLVSSRTVIVEEDVSDLSLGQEITYLRGNYVIDNNDNLTIAIRKKDREAARINTALEKPVYDETVFVQQMDVTKGVSDTIRSGSVIYQGPQNNPTAQAWVLHGTDQIIEKIESFNKDMPGGLYGSNSILVHIYTGAWANGSAVYQNGVDTGAVINNPGDPDFDAPELVGGVNGVELVLPPNRRTSVIGGAIVKFPANSFYKASLDDRFAGEELMVISNDSIRAANIDYEETFGGPKAKIRLLRSMPPSTRLRFRSLPSFGSALAKLAGNVTLQLAYDGGRIISTIAGVPVDIRASDAGTGGAAMALRGSLEINGQGFAPGDIVGGIFGPKAPNIDRGFLIGKEDNKPKEVWTGLGAVKTHDGYTGSAWFRKTASGVSAGSSVTPIDTAGVEITANQVVRVQMNLTARRTDGPIGGASFRIEGTFHHDGVNIVASGFASTSIFGTHGDGSGYAVAFGINASGIVPTVYGTNGSTIQWVVGIDYQLVEDSL